MSFIWFSTDAGLNHLTPPGHPEQVKRLEYVQAALASKGLERREAPVCTDDDLLLGHTRAYIDRINKSAPESGRVALDGDTHMSPGSLEAVMRGVGGCVAAVDAVLDGEAKSAFVGCRPPGHHAEKETPMGFCVFGNSAIAALHALERRGLARVAVLDFDVHHGNGTQDILWDEGRAMFVSSHQMPLFPGTGRSSETGAHGQIVNLPLGPGTGGAEMRGAWESALEQVKGFAPELIIVSAGFDAHADDPLASLEWEVEDFAWITEQICDLADGVCGGKIVSNLEGGYDLDALAAAASAHVDILAERSR